MTRNRIESNIKGDASALLLSHPPSSLHLFPRALTFEKNVCQHVLLFRTHTSCTHLQSDVLKPHGGTEKTEDADGSLLPQPLSVSIAYLSLNLLSDVLAHSSEESSPPAKAEPSAIRRTDIFSLPFELKERIFRLAAHENYRLFGELRPKRSSDGPHYGAVNLFQVCRLFHDISETIPELCCFVSNSMPLDLLDRRLKNINERGLKLDIDLKVNKTNLSHVKDTISRLIPLAENWRAVRITAEKSLTSMNTEELHAVMATAFADLDVQSLNLPELESFKCYDETGDSLPLLPRMDWIMPNLKRVGITKPETPFAHGSAVAEIHLALFKGPQKYTLYFLRSSTLQHITHLTLEFYSALHNIDVPELFDIPSELQLPNLTVLHLRGDNSEVFECFMRLFALPNLKTLEVFPTYKKLEVADFIDMAFDPLHYDDWLSVLERPTKIPSVENFKLQFNEEPALLDPDVHRCLLEYYKYQHKLNWKQLSQEPIIVQEDGIAVPSLLLEYTFFRSAFPNLRRLDVQADPLIPRIQYTFDRSEDDKTAVTA